MQFATVLAAVDKPDIFVLLTNLASAFSYLTLFLRYFLIALALLWMIFAFANLWSVSTANGGAPNKFFPSKSQPTAAGAWMQMFVSGLLFIMAYKMLPASILSSVITGDVIGVEIYSMGTYDTSALDGEDARDIIVDVLRSVMQFIGWLAYYRGFSTWYHMSQGTTDERVGRVFGYFIFGTLCMSIEWVNSLIANTIGFDLFGFFV